MTETDDNDTGFTCLVIGILAVVTIILVGHVFRDSLHGETMQADHTQR